MIVAGVMSGTSADGIDVALTRISGRGDKLRIKLLAHEHFVYAKPVRNAVLAAMNATSTSVADLARLNSLL
ncbi:MAG: anhydro-N-acetylmuramic acid kinase, partial [Acidobacteria bacterium]|nr:anhydro-N-acetylmuramic acid kinase [Acidobacteriota bacterium]